MKKLKPWFAQIFAVLLLTATVFCYWVLPALDISIWLMASLLFIYALFSYSYWQVLHESFHQHLLPHKKANLILGRSLAILFGAPYHVLKTGHLTHHAMNRTPGDQTEIIYSTDRKTKRALTLKYYVWILGGLYIAEMLGMAAAFIPKKTLSAMAKKAESHNPVKARVLLGLAQHQAAMRIDSVLILLTIISSAYLYGASAWLLLMVFLIRALMVSLFDNIYHYGTSLEERKNALNLALPNSISLLFLHANYHGAHHQNPTIPWHQLPDTLNGKAFDKPFGRQVLAELKTPIYLDKNTPH